MLGSRSTGASLLDQARLAFRMKANVDRAASSTDALPDLLPPGWVRIPVSFQVTLPAEIMDHARQDDAAP